jgi:hypothetical protein
MVHVQQLWQILLLAAVAVEANPHPQFGGLFGSLFGGGNRGGGGKGKGASPSSPRPGLGLPGIVSNQPPEEISPDLLLPVWKPRVKSKFQIILSAAVELEHDHPPSPDVDIWDLDLFYHSKKEFDDLKKMGKKVMCYFSAGTSEDWRADFNEFKASDQGAKLPMWPGERWLDIRSPDVWKTMQKRIKFAGQQGCDAIDPDNMGELVPALDLLG